MEDLNDNDLFLALEADRRVTFEIEQVFGSNDNKDMVAEDVDDGLVECMFSFLFFFIFSKCLLTNCY